MRLKLKHTRNKYWEWYNIYILPTIRFSRLLDSGDIRLYKLDLIWITFNLSLEFRREP